MMMQHFGQQGMETVNNQLRDSSFDWGKAAGWGIMAVLFSTSGHKLRNGILLALFSPLLPDASALLQKMAELERQRQAQLERERVARTQAALQSALQSISLKFSSPVTQSTKALPSPDLQTIEAGKWLKLIHHPSIVVILGGRGKGKSALGYRLLEYLRWTASCYVVGLPEGARKLLLTT